MEKPSTDSLRRAGTEALSVGLGLGILGVQRLQVRRREWERTTGRATPSPQACLRDVSGAVSSLMAMARQFGPR
ncbi:MAG: hypothetical protein WCJ88_08775 [Actinomycetes bacterium]